MNLFKSSILGSLVFLSLFFYTVSNAAPKSEDTLPIAKGVLVASVDIKNAKIVFQDGKNFKISFTIANGEGIQAGVKYGIKLFPDGTNPYLADEKVYDESLTLQPNSSVSREVTYTPPTNLSGSYIILLESKNESGFPFGNFVVGTIKLTASTKGVQILPGSCTVKISTDKDGKQYAITKTIEINPEESLSLTCTAINNSPTPVSVNPIFDTKYSSSYGEHAPQTPVDNEVIKFEKNQKRNFTINLPKGDIAKPYNLKVTLSDGENISNEVSVNYIIRGLSATIQQVSLDKDYYRVGEKAELSLVWFGSGMGDGTGSNVSLNTSITNKKGRECIEPNTQIIVRDISNPANKLSFPVKTTCEDPLVKVVISDREGNVLDQKEFQFKTLKIPKSNVSNALNHKYIIPGVIALIIIAGIGIYMNRKKKINSVKM